ncbi:MAG: hypothetical protein WCV85_06165 [Patescibacteria group bacterium]|jgi:hypothetical protein
MFETDEDKRQEIQRLKRKIEKQKFVFWVISVLYCTLMMFPVPMFIRIWADSNPEVAVIIENVFFLVAFVLIWFGAWLLAVNKVVSAEIRNEEKITQLKKELGEIEEE